MAEFSDTHLGKLRAAVGDRLLLMPGAHVAIENAKEEILLQRRRSENLESVVRREIAEEVGLIVDDLPAMLPNMARSVDAYLRYVATGDFQPI
ncbi:hypothetical protein GCM10025795_15010 [Verticiella sediminum]